MKISSVMSEHRHPSRKKTWDGHILYYLFHLHLLQLGEFSPKTFFFSITDSFYHSSVYATILLTFSTFSKFLAFICNYIKSLLNKLRYTHNAINYLFFFLTIKSRSTSYLLFDINLPIPPSCWESCNELLIHRSDLIYRPGLGFAYQERPRIDIIRVRFNRALGSA